MRSSSLDRTIAERSEGLATGSVVQADRKVRWCSCYLVPSMVRSLVSMSTASRHYSPWLLVALQAHRSRCCLALTTSERVVKLRWLQ